MLVGFGLAFLLFGTSLCVEEAVPRPVWTPIPQIEVDTLDIYFDHTDIDGQAVEFVLIENDGDGDLYILNVSTPDAPFDAGPVSSVLVPPGQVTEFEVAFTPTTAGSFSSTVLIESDDPTTPLIEVGLHGIGLGPSLEVSPEEHDFGSLYVGCEALQSVLLKNAGTTPLVISDLDYSADSVELLFDADPSVNGPLPWELAPGSEVEVWVEYAPLDELQDLGTLTVESTDTAQLTAVQVGTGALYGENLDVFEQALSDQVDILFALDHSGSMLVHHQNVLNNFSGLMSELADSDTDYHVAAVYQDDGCIVGSQPYVDETMSLVDQQSLFETMVCTTGACNYGSNTERAFMLFEAALSSDNTGTGGCNEGFYREGAALALVGVSDEPEQSVNNYAYYVSLFQSLKNDSDDVVIHAIGGDYPQGCTSSDGSTTADPYTGMYEATVATGGLMLSICDESFGDHLQAVAEVTGDPASSFELTGYPAENTLVVTVNGFTTTTGWAYNAVDNTIDFEEDYVPEGGSTIEVSYALQGDCD